MSTKPDLPCKIVFIGPSGAGKTTVIERLAEDFDVEKIDVQPFIWRFEKKHDKSPPTPEEKRGIYHEFIDALHGFTGNVLEIANGHPKDLFPDIINAFFNEDPGVAVYVDAGFERCMERVQEREWPTPRSTMEEHHQYSATYFEQRLEPFNIPLHELNGENPLPEKYRELRNVLRETCPAPA